MNAESISGSTLIWFVRLGNRNICHDWREASIYSGVTSRPVLIVTTKQPFTQHFYHSGYLQPPSNQRILLRNELNSLEGKYFALWGYVGVGLVFVSWICSCEQSFHKLWEKLLLATCCSVLDCETIEYWIKWHKNCCSLGVLIRLGKQESGNNWNRS